MSREIKFRAWYTGNPHPLDPNNIEDYERAQMINNVQNLYDGMGVDKNPITGGISSFGDLLSDEHFVVMQFTGLHDKNGKEIYEGDVVRDCLTMRVYLVRFGFCIKYAFNGWYLETIDEYQAPINNDSDSDRNHMIEVIGNIHENPKLLGGGK